MTVRIRSALDTLPAYAPGRTVPGAIKLASNELSFPTLPSVAAAIADAVADESAGINRYPDNGTEALIGALAEHIGAPRTHVVAGNGSVALCQQLVQATELHADLRLDTSDAGSPQILRGGDGVLEQRRLPHPRASAQHQCAAEATAHRVQDPVDTM